MEADPGLVLEYYRRAAEFANVEWKRQDTGTDGLPTSTADATTSVVSTSSVASVSSESVISTSSQSSVISTSSTAATSNTSHTTTSTTALSSLTSNVSTPISTAVMTTDSNGHTVTSTIIVVPTTPISSHSNKSTTNTGAIVGGVVGGIALIALLVIAGLLIRRKMRHDEFEANIFDPDRNVERPTSIGATGAGRNFDLGGAGVGAGAAAAGAGAAMAESRTSNVTPYPYAATSTGPTSTYHGSSVAGAPEMQQSPVSSGYYPDYYPNYGQQQQYGAVPSVGVGETFPNPYAPGYHPAAYEAAGAAGIGAGMMAAGAGINRNQTATSNSSGYPAPTSVYTPTSPTYDGRTSVSGSPPMGATAGLAPVAPLNPRAAKEREAFSRSNTNFAVANPNEPARTNPSPTPSHNSAVLPSPIVVHQDGGRAPEEDPSPEGEIPPTYDSIPRDTR